MYSLNICSIPPGTRPWPGLRALGPWAPQQVQSSLSNGSLENSLLENSPGNKESWEARLVESGGGRRSAYPSGQGGVQSWGQQGPEWRELQGRLSILSPTGSLGRSSTQHGWAAGLGTSP